MASQIVPERPACDLCHNRKVKCDRYDPCMNCVDARTECRRTRPRRSMRPRVSRIARLSERLSSVEQLVLNPHPGAPASQPVLDPREEAEHIARSGRTSQAPSSGGWSARARESESTAHPAATAEDTSMQPANEARRFIQQELQRSDHLSSLQRTVLENALSLVNRLSTATCHSKVSSAGHAQALEEQDETTQEFSIETYYMMSKHMVHQTSPGKHIHWPDHVSVKGLEHMSLSLVEGKLDRQTSLHYRVCVYVKAIFFLARMRQPQLTPRLRSHMKMSHTKYMTAASRALEQINLTENPSISLIQALLSGALLHQMQGNITKAWTMTSFAARLLVALNYHTVSNDTPIQSQEDEDARRCLFSCHYLDKSLSMHLLRPPSLPRLRFSPASLRTTNGQAGLAMIAKTVSEFAEVQEAALEVFFAQSIADDDGEERAARLDGAIQQLVALKRVLDERRLNGSQQELELEWDVTEFRYHAIMTTLLQYRSEWEQDKPGKKDKCLQSARQALEALRQLQNTINASNVFNGSYPIFLSWTILFYPMTPFYIIFCNVVGTSNMEDYQLLRDTTQGLQQFIDYNPAIARLYHLFTTFLNLCSPLVNPPVVQEDAMMVSSLEQPISMDMRPEMGPWWNSEDMWELFNTQPLLQWVDADNLIL
ncbi:hypothetical protein BO85DRAFT_516783 [Aspergillus piperis CBS 112811]|uniref:Zn(2)-C6 fungal-type domain-containing protein n=1 Tax=Aspergillus piperis CBS 112811 TaxID=1448313 RepID=A0A8G1RAQ0_9EURO|nr:hypothetical protein BO85DRAFT_516783 [Aspergillus piperis CBS 112811]RAH62252.1 hypothetical protein BO85DRAFT_516783 [Aspergillus piperis CBS 112811]